MDHKESWAPKNWCFWTVVLEKILESPLDCKEIQPVHPKGDQSFIGRTVAEAETPNTLATWCKELTHWKRPWCWERLRRWGRHGWMASPTQWTWVWVSSESWYGQGGLVSQADMVSQRVRHDWLTELINNLLLSYFWVVLYRYATVKVCLTNFNKLCFNMFFNFTSGFFDLYYWFHCGWRHIWYDFNTAVHGVAESRTLVSNWTELSWSE